MDITPAVPANLLRIDAYGAGGFTINGMRYEGSVVIFPEGVLPWSASYFSETAFQDILSASPSPIELLVVGSGVAMQRLKPALLTFLRILVGSVEIMETGAACRTYNVLLAEGRRVGAILIAVE